MNIDDFSFIYLEIFDFLQHSCSCQYTNLILHLINLFTKHFILSAARVKAIAFSFYFHIVHC